MRFSNLHTHTCYCDGEGSPAEFCEAALNAGLVSLGFSAHAPIDGRVPFCTGWHLRKENAAAYRACVLKARLEYAGRLDVFLGLEADYIAGCQSPRDFASWGADYLIGSVHCVIPPGLSSQDFFERAGKFLCVDGSAADWARLVEDFFAGDVYRLLDAYWDSVAEMVREGGFDVLAHADLVKKNNRDTALPASCRFNTGDARYVAGVRRVADALAGTGIVAEINTGGINRGKISETYPSAALLRLFCERGIPVTINADAHTPSHVRGAYDRALETAACAGYGAIILFTGGPGGLLRRQTEALTQR